MASNDTVALHGGGANPDTKCLPLPVADLHGGGDNLDTNCLLVADVQGGGDNLDTNCLLVADVQGGGDNLDTNCLPVVEAEGNNTDGSFIETSGLQATSENVNEKPVGIVTPEPNQEVTPFIEDFLERVRKLQNRSDTKRPLRSLPVGVRLTNDGIIYLSSSRKYRENFEFEATGKILGTGTDDPVRVVKDSMNGVEHALKSVPLTDFKENEIRCWVDQNKYEYSPKLYMFQVQNDHVLLHMEILKDVMTLKCPIDARPTIIRERLCLLEPLALHIHRLILAVVNQFHNTGWIHNDLNPSNVLLKVRSNELLKVYILDFDTAKQADNIERDMQDIASLFQGMIIGCEDLQYNRIIFRDKDKTEIASLITQCTYLVQKSDVPRYIEVVGRLSQRAITAYISTAPGGSEHPFIGNEWPSLPSPPSSPESPVQVKFPTCTRDESQINLTELANALELEGRAITENGGTWNNVDGQGDGNGTLAQPLAKLELDSRQTMSTEPLLSSAEEINDQQKFQSVHQKCSSKHEEIKSEERSSDQDQ